MVSTITKGTGYQNWTEQVTTTWSQELQLIQRGWENSEAWLPTHHLCVDTSLTVQVRNSREDVGSNGRNSCKLLAELMGESQQRHMGTAPIPYFPFRSPGDWLGHLLWHTSPLSSPLSLLHLPRRCRPRRSFCFACQDKSKNKARNKGRMLRGVLSLPNTARTPPSPAAESLPRRPVPWGARSQMARGEGGRTPGDACTSPTSVGHSGRGGTTYS